MATTWQEVSQKKRAARDALIPKEWRLKSLPSDSTLNVLDVPRTCGILNEKELDITENYDATALRQAIREKKFSCLEVTTAYCKRAAIAHQLTNCLSEINFELSLRRAAILDGRLAEEGDKNLPPLFGLPISIKDPFRIPGLDSSVGLAALTFKESTFTSPLVLVLLRAGAIIHCKTTMPQTGMSADTESNVFGRTLNPQNKNLSVGGSSGGEGALVKMKGSAVGVGSDIAGSIRIPSMCNGLYGICPSRGRVPFSGQQYGSLPGQSALSIEARAGPIARTMRDCKLLLESIASMEPWMLDEGVSPGFWSDMDMRSVPQSPSSKALTIGVIHTDSVVTPLPPIQNIVKEVASKLSSAGVKVINIEPPPGFKELSVLGFRIFGVEGGNNMANMLETWKEPPINSLKGGKWPPRRKARTFEEMRQLHARRAMLMKEMLGLWKQADGKGGTVELDALILPMAPHPVPPRDQWTPVTYTTAWVTLDCPAGSLPVRDFVQKDLEGDLTTKPLSQSDGINRRLWDKDKIDRTVYLGSPLSIQVAAPRLQEKRLYEVMAAIDEILHGSGQNQGSKAKL